MRTFPHKALHRVGFMLIELIIVLAIIAVLAAVLLLVLNPAEVTRQSRDAARLSDLESVNHVLNIFQVEAGVDGAGLGASTTVYISIPDPAATSSAGTDCSSLSLPAIPSGYRYHCGHPDHYRRVDGTGWIPVNLNLIPSGLPISSYPADPVNTLTGKLYYSYMPGAGVWHLAGPLESRRHQLGGDKDAASKDGGSSPSLFEKGGNLLLSPVEYGDSTLVAVWRLNESMGTSAFDSSGNGHNGTLTNGPTWITGKIGNALSFDAINDYVSVSDAPRLNPASVMSIAAWARFPTLPYTGQVGVSKDGQYRLLAGDVSGTRAAIRFATAGTGWGAGTLAGTTTLQPNQWYHIAATYDGTNWRLYVNGNEEASVAAGGALSGGSNPLYIGASAPGTNLFSGMIDDVRVYDRALTSPEVQAIAQAK